MGAAAIPILDARAPPPAGFSLRSHPRRADCLDADLFPAAKKAGAAPLVLRDSSRKKFRSPEKLPFPFARRARRFPGRAILPATQTGKKLVTKTFDITDDLKLIEERILEMKAKQKAAIGEMIIATGAEKILSSNQLSGLVLCGIDQAKADPAVTKKWEERDAAHFRRKSKSGAGAASSGGGSDALPGKPANPATIAATPQGKAPDLLSRAQTA